MSQNRLGVQPAVIDLDVAPVAKARHVRKKILARRLFFIEDQNCAPSSHNTPFLPRHRRQSAWESPVAFSFGPEPALEDSVNCLVKRLGAQNPPAETVLFPF